MSPELGRIVLVDRSRARRHRRPRDGRRAAAVRRCPGDIAIEGENGGIYIPLGSMIVISLILTLVLNFFLRR